MKTLPKYFLRLTLALTCIAPLTACATTSGPPIEGKVIEEGTNQPIPNAIVVARWTEAITLVFDSRTSCVHVESTTTDHEGRFQLPRYKGKTPTHLDSYKPGYERSEQYFKTQAYLRHDDILKPFTGSRGERLEYLERTLRATGCHNAGHRRRNLYPLYEALYNEAKPLANTAQDRETLQWMRRLAASVATAEDRSMTQRESDQLVERYLKEHLQ